MRIFFGVDIGGTNINAGFVNEAGDVLVWHQVKTETATRTSEEILDEVVRLFDHLLATSDVVRDDVIAVGVGSPGVTDKAMRVIVRAYNLPFDHVEAAAYLEERIGLPVFVGNDANVAALAEARIGAGRGAESSLTVTLGTGVGGGMVINDRVYSGFNGAGVEVGHVLLKLDGLPCTCGRRGCVEVYCAASALVRQTAEAAEENPDSALAAAIRAGKRVSGRLAFDLADQGCPVAKAVVNQYTRYVGEAVASYINALNPERILIGGGVSRQGKSFTDAVAEIALREAFLVEGVPKPAILPAELSNDAGLVGAAFFAMDGLAALSDA